MSQDKTSITDSLATWEASVPDFSTSTSNYGTSETSFNDGGSIQYPTGSVYTAGVDWQTWANGYSGEVISDPGATSVTINFSGVAAFGFEVEPDQFQIESITVMLSNGTQLTDQVNGDAGAQFFGFSGGGVTSLTITDSSSDDFAFGNFYYENSAGIDYRAPSAKSDPIVSNASSVAANYAFVGYYLGSNSSYLTPTKATELSDAGLPIVSIYENKNMADSSYYKTNEFSNGVSVGETAYADAIKDGQGATPGSTIYFGVDLDPGTKMSFLSDIATFFEGIARGFQDEAAKLSGGTDLFTVGVYGAGITDNLIKDTDHLAQYSWLAGSKGWTGSSTYTDWDIKQTVNGASVQGVTVDTDQIKGSYFGEWGA